MQSFLRRWTGAAGVVVITSLGTSAAADVPVPREPRASYTLRVRLDEGSHTLHGSGKIRFEATPEATTNELWFHLFLNAFKDDRSLFLRGPSSGGRSGGLDGHPGHIELKRLTSPRYAGVDLWKSRDRHSPGDAEDTTDIRVPLPSPLGPGETLELEFEFDATLPELVERTGYDEDFHLVAQWFPKLAKQEKDGSWAHFPFHAFAEFYADFGDYDVELDVPATHVVGSTGTLERLDEKKGRVRYRAHAENVHDFAWTSWPGFHVEQRRIGNIDVSLLTPPEAELGRAHTWTTLALALPDFQRRYGSYPFPTLTVVQPPSTAGRAGRREYPTFITTGGIEWTERLGGRGTELVTVHELGHQWFQGILASNEARYPFLDEGINSFAELRFLENHFGAGSIVETPFLRVSRGAVARYAGLGWGAEEIVAQPARDFTSFRALASQVYGRTTLALETLRRVYGTERIDRALLEYTSRWRFRHPEPEDFYATIETHVGAPARSALVTLLEKRGTVDFRLQSAFTETNHDAAPDRRFTTFARVMRAGNLTLPVELRVHFRDGSTRLFQLPSPDPVELVEFNHASEISSLVVDPEQKIFIDENLLNKSFYPQRRPSNRLGDRITFWFELAARFLAP